MKTLLKISIAVLVVVGVFFGYQINRTHESAPPVQAENLGATDATQLIGGFPYFLSGSGVSSSATSLTLTSLTIPQNGYKIQDADLSSIFYITFEPGNRSHQEFASCTTVVQNISGTATLSGCVRGLSPVQPYTASTTLMFPHSGASTVIFSNPPQVYRQAAFVGNTATITAPWIFSSTSPPYYDNVGAQASGTYISTTSEFVSWAGLAAVTNAGTVNATESVKGIAELSTALEQASSTILGGTSAGLVMQSRYATDTPQSGCAVGYTATSGAGCSVIAQLTGKIRQTWLDLSAAFTFTGGITSTASANSFGNTNLTNATTTSLYIGSQRVTPEFGGNGIDGALSLTSGTTTLDLGSATVFEKDYTSISITGTGHLAFSNANANGTFIVLRSQGNLTLTCSPAPCIDVQALGGASGAGAAGGVSTSNISGSTANATNTFHLFATNGGIGGSTSSGVTGALPTAIAPSAFSTSTLMKYGGQFWVGSGGGGGGCSSGGAATCSLGDGGRGGGGLLMEIAGALNFTTTNGILAWGGNGVAGAMSASGEHGGGGGGGGGFVEILYNILTAFSGSVSVTPGTGGNANTTNYGNSGIYGGGGGTTAYSTGSNGTDISSAGAKDGGDGATGTSIVKLNTNFF